MSEEIKKLPQPEAAYLDKVKQYEDQCYSQEQANIPDGLAGNPTATAIYNLVNDLFEQQLKDTTQS